MDIQELIDYLYDFNVSADISIESLAQDIYSMFSNKESKNSENS